MFVRCDSQVLSLKEIRHHVSCENSWRNRLLDVTLIESR